MTTHDLKDSNSTCGNLVIPAATIITQCAYYYIAINLFPNHISASNTLFVLCTCLCFSVTWLLSNYIAYGKPNNTNKLTGRNTLSIVLLTVAMLFSYFFELRFKTFIASSYFMLIIKAVYNSITAKEDIDPIKKIISNAEILILHHKN